MACHEVARSEAERILRGRDCTQKFEQIFVIRAAAAEIPRGAPAAAAADRRLAVSGNFKVFFGGLRYRGPTAIGGLGASFQP